MPRREAPRTLVTARHVGALEDFMSSFRSLVLLAALVAGGCAPSAVQAQSRAPNPSTAPARSERALLFVLTTGLEDVQAMTSVFRHAKVAAEQHRLSEVAVLVYGRGVHAFDGDISARPPQLLELIRQAMAAGVRVMLCANAIEHMGVDRAHLDPAPTEIVPNAIVTLVGYVERDAAVVRY